MNILFLDMDGVLNSKQHFLMLKEQKLDHVELLMELPTRYMKTYTDAKNAWCLKYILENVPDLKIVISSAWRLHFDIEQFKEMFQHYGMDGERIIGKTSVKGNSTRAEEIRWWVTDHLTDKWVALDDHPIFDLNEAEKQNEVLTDPWVGLTMQEAFKIIAIFKPDFKPPLFPI